MERSVVDPRFDVPGLPPHHVPRPRLVALVEDGAWAAVTVVSAGAGAGKSVLLADWARAQPEPVAWLSLTPEDDDAARFWRLFLEGGAAVGGRFPPVAWTPGHTAELLDAVFGHEPSGERLHVVLDDAHVLTDPQILDGLDRLVRRWPHRVRLLLTRRGPLGLPLHRYRVAGDLSEIDAAQLAMTGREAATLLAAHGVRLPAAELAQLVARTEGWPAGLRLAALWLRSQRGPQPLPDVAASGTGRITEYLTEEVLAALPARTRRVLVETSFLDVVPADLADAVTGLPGCGALLAEQAELNAMVLATDPVTATFRYHHLLREVLRGREEADAPGDRRDRRLRAADWYRGRGDFSRALTWTLAAGDLERVRRLVLGGGLVEAFVAQHELSAPLRTAVAASPSTFRPPGPDGDQGDVPPQRVEDQVARWAVAALTVQPADAAAAVAALPLPDLAGVDVQLALTQHVAALLLARKAVDVALLDRAVAGIRALTPAGGPARTPGLVAAALLAQARSRFAVGRLAEVPPLLDAAVDEAERDGAAPVALDALATRAFVVMTAGLAAPGWQSVRRAEALLGVHAGLIRPVTLDLAVARGCELAADWAGMGGAVGRVLAAGPLYPDPGTAATVALVHGIYLLGAGRFEEAAAHLGTTPALRQEGLGPLGLLRDRELAEVELRLGRPGRAVELLERHDANPLRVVAAAVLARALTALGDTGGARARIEQALAVPGPPVDTRVRVELLLAQVVTELAIGREERAAQLAQEAVDLAPDGLVAPFARALPQVGDLLLRRPALARAWPLAPDSAPDTALDTAFDSAFGPVPAAASPGGADTLLPAQPVDIVAELSRLARLHTGGLLTDAEFTSRKAALLRRA